MILRENTSYWLRVFSIICTLIAEYIIFGFGWLFIGIVALFTLVFLLIIFPKILSNKVLELKDDSLRVFRLYRSKSILIAETVKVKLTKKHATLYFKNDKPYVVVFSELKEGMEKGLMDYFDKQGVVIERKY